MSVEPQGTGHSRIRISLNKLKTFDSLRNPSYRLYLSATAGQWAAMNMQMVTRSLLIYRLTGSGAILGGMALAQATPILFLSFFGGIIADRMQKKYIMLIGQVSSAMLSLGIALALTLGYLSAERAGSWWILIASAALQGTIVALRMPSSLAIIREIVGDKQVMNAVALNNLTMNGFRLVGPALAGIIIEAFDFDMTYYTVTGILLISTIGLVLIPRTRVIPVDANVSNPLKDLPNGIRYIRHDITILLVLLFALLSSVLGMPFQQIMPMFTEDILKVGASGFGILMSASGLGAILGSLILASLPNRKRGIVFLLSGLAMGIALVGFSFSQLWYLSLFLITFVGLAQTGKVTLENALLQYYSDAEYQGRVLSFLTMQMSFASFGTFIAGVLAEVVGVQWSIGGLGMALIFVSFVMLIITPRLRNLE